MKKLRVTVDGKVYDVLVEILDEGPAGAPPPPAPVVTSAGVSAPAPSSAPPAAASAAPGEVPSPLAGKVVAVDVEVGAQVAEGDLLITLEAMKMNTYIYAPRAGVVSAIHVAPGDAVEEGQGLVAIT